MLAYVRKGVDCPPVVVVVNFAGVAHENYRLALPSGGRWAEIFNTDVLEYGGSGVGNLGAVQAQPDPHHGRPASALVRVPPYGVILLSPEQG